MDIDKSRKEIKKFKNNFLLSTEFVSYCVIVPILFIYIYSNLNFSEEQISLFIKSIIFTLCISIPTTHINNLIVISPIEKYFKKILAGEEISESEHEKAQKRFFSLPYIHSGGAFFRWIFGLSIGFIPFSIISKLNSIQQYNLFILILVIPPLGSILHFLLTEIFIQNLLSKGVLKKIMMKDFTLQMSMTKRILFSILVIAVVPVTAIIGTFLTIIHDINPDFSFPMMKLTGIGIFAVVVALSISLALLKTIKNKISIIIAFLEKVGAGDLSAEKGIIAINDDLTKINQTIYVMKKNITEMIYEINKISSQLDVSTGEISNITDSFSQDTQNQAATVQEVTSTIEEISAAMDNVSSGAQEQLGRLKSLVNKITDLSNVINEMEKQIVNASSLTKDISSQAAQGENSLRYMSESMIKINESAQQMTNIINIINDISDRINLLSLNAAIEAARAGDAGRGFAVVADEISKLADSTATSVKEIDSLIKATEDEINKGLSNVNDVVDRISKITKGIDSMGDMVLNISSYMSKQVETNKMVDEEANKVIKKSEEIEMATREQKLAMSEVVKAVDRINELTQSISVGSEEIASNTKENAKMADILKNKVEQFKLA
jgi:methyl-accepting chemotaxis protein